MRVSKDGLELIKGFEGLSLTPYKCSAGIPTIGYGSTYYKNGARVLMSDPPITLEEANELLLSTVACFEDGVNEAVKVPLTQDQFDALVSLAYNIGLGRVKKPSKAGFKTSTLLRRLNSKMYIEAAHQFLVWNRAGGVVNSGLVDRRWKERQLFLSGTIISKANLNT